MIAPVRFAPFLLAILAFWLPFLELSCKDKSASQSLMTKERLATPTGFKVMLGDLGDKQDGKKSQGSGPFDVNYKLVGAFAALLIAGLASFQRSGSLSVGMAIVALACLAWFGSDVQQGVAKFMDMSALQADAAKEGMAGLQKVMQSKMMEQIEIRFLPGYWICLGSTLLGMALQFGKRGGS
jgi:hypothetical protein